MPKRLIGSIWFLKDSRSLCRRVTCRGVISGGAENATSKNDGQSVEVWKMTDKLLTEYRDLESDRIT